MKIFNYPQKLIISFLKFHILVKHEGLRYKCTYPNCTAEYKSYMGLQVHKENCHDVQTEPCDICGKVFKRGDQMRRHKS